jgi:hypothetical protein
MPHTAPQPPGAPLTPVPVAVLLPPPDPARRVAPRRGQPADWCGLTPDAACTLIDRYTRRRDVVIDLDRNATVIDAARRLERRPATLLTDRHGSCGSQPGPRLPLGGEHGAGLIVARLPRPGAYTLDLHGLTASMRIWRAALRPGGYLLAALTVSDWGGNHASTVITAARAVGLLYHQHLIAVRVALPEHEPRAEPDTAATTPPELVDGRHVSTHTNLLVFAAPGGEAHDA